MIIGDNYIFIHLDKCAGVFISKILKEHCKGKQLGGRHCSPPAHQKEIEKLKKNQEIIVLGSIRSPYQFYVSLFSYGCKNKNSNYAALVNYDPIYKKIYSDSHNIQNFQFWLKDLLNEPLLIMGELLNGRIKGQKNKSRGLILIKDELKVEDQCGLMTRLFFKRFMETNYKYLENNDMTDLWVTDFIKVENLINDLEKVSHKLKSPPRNKLFRQKLKKENQTQHDDWENYYTQELADLVWEKDQYIFEKFNYPKLLISGSQNHNSPDSDKIPPN